MADSEVPGQEVLPNQDFWDHLTTENGGTSVEIYGTGDDFWTNPDFAEMLGASEDETPE